ncbi:MAG: threonine ammonia-lyase, biosynthetic [Deltaproteobacteria bacterium]|nr:threonine ammonia-lyase, biosynthetic [Deltaproteobacteria bacterium]
MSDSLVDQILSARVYDVARETALERAPRLSARLGNHIWLKREDLQSVFSFKLRGAYNKIALLPQERAAHGVIAASAGNHAQGVALAARQRGIRARIVMPVTTPPIKVEAVKALGAEVVLHGDSYDEAHELARRQTEEEGFVYVHAYDDLDVIAGQGTVGVEILRQHTEPIDAIFVPVGGGGLIAGIAAYVKEQRPETAIIGVEPADAACLHAALRDGERTVLDRVGIFADGAAVRQVGEEPFRIVRDRVDEVICVDTDEICAAILDIFEDTRTMAEPAGALAVAGAKKFVETRDAADQTLVAIVSGANINFHRLRHISERAELGEHREVIFAATVPERAGTFKAFCEAIGDHEVTEFNYRYVESSDAHVFVGIKLDGGDAERVELLAHVEECGYPCVDMTHNEMAKVHVRHLVGGRVNGLAGERMLRFEFPERPGALGRFLSQMHPDWNLSLFHYRNHGAAVGRVLVGMQVPEGQDEAFESFLKELAYPYTEETHNPAYHLFLS